MNKTDDTNLLDMCDSENCSFVSDINREEENDLKYDNIPEGYDIMNVNIETEYVNYMKKENNISIYNEDDIYDSEYKVCLSKKSEEEEEKLEELENERDELISKKQELTENKSFYQVLFG